MKIKTKLIGAFVVVSLLFILVVFFTLRGIKQVNYHFDIIADETAPALVALGNIKASGLRIQMEALSVVLGEEEGEEELREAKEDIEKWEAEFAKLAEDEEEKQYVSAIEETGVALYQASQELVRLAKQGAGPEVIQKQKEVLEEREEAFIAIIDKAIANENNELEEQDTIADQVFEQTERWALIVSLIALLLAIVAGTLLLQWIVKPILALASVTKRIKEGDLSQRAGIITKDEIGDLATSFNSMADSIQKKNEELQTFNEELQTSNEELKSTTEELETSNEELKSTNEELEAASEELRESQEKLVQQEKLAAVGQLASGIGHELRNPLGVMKNAVYYIKSKVGMEDEKLAKHLKIMDKEIDNSTKIINDLLGFSRTRKPDIAPTDIHRVIDDALSAVELPTNVRISKEFGKQIPQAMVDPDQIRQVFLNLALNSIQAMNEGGMLTIVTRQSNSFVEVHFKDTGCGIPQENLKKLFDPFFTTKSRGVGLGLAVSHGIVERHKGKLGVQSTVGKGTTFTVLLPVS